MNDIVFEKFLYWMESEYSLHEADAICRWLTDKDAPKEDIWKIMEAIENEDTDFIVNYNN